jgi:hypothetical protein
MCPPLPPFQALGTVGTAWELLAVTLVLFLAASAAAGVGYRCEQRIRSRRAPERRAPGDRERLKSHRADFYAARAGLITSSFFAFVILVEAIPTYFFLHGC